MRGEMCGKKRFIFIDFGSIPLSVISFHFFELVLEITKLEMLT